MRNKVSFTILGKPIGKERPRKGKHGNIYTPEKTKEYEELVQYEYIKNCKNCFLTGGILAIIKAYYKIPKSTSKKNKCLMEEGIIRPKIKPDSDNVSKIILDSLNNIAYKDDSHVVDLYFRKFYSYNPRVEVELIEISK